jgi:hypothetical protein
MTDRDHDALFAQLLEVEEQCEVDSRRVCEALLDTLAKWTNKVSEHALQDAIYRLYEASGFNDEDEEWIKRSRLFAQATRLRRKLLKFTPLNPTECKAAADLVGKLRDHMPPDNDAHQGLHWGCPVPADLVPGEPWCIWPGMEGTRFA